MIKIYTLEDEYGYIKYVGKTNRKLLSSRLSEHICNSKTHNDKKSCWIKSLLKVNKKPIINLLDEVSVSEWQFWEQHYISLMKSYGFILKNHTIGGDLDNTGSKWSEETREKQRISRLNNTRYKYKKGPMSQEHKDSISKSLIGKESPNKGNKFTKTPEQLLKVSGSNNGMFGRKHSQESIDKMKATRLLNKQNNKNI